jgi:orotidine-5'-phosphate decarboxylase
MTDLFGENLLAAIRKKEAPICVGIDPMPDMIPDEVRNKSSSRLSGGGQSQADLDSIFDFVTTVLGIVAPLVPCVKFQSAYFERFLWDGVEAYFNLIQEARELGLIVIGDIKRGDIGSTSQAYAEAHLAGFVHPLAGEEEWAFPDAVTVNPMLGLDTIEPFVNAARHMGKGLFVLVRTSNPGSADLQDAMLADGRTWSEMLADRLAPIAARDGLVGPSGYSSIGAVVGATQPHTMSSLRKRLPRSIFLLPGYGTQGATADMTRAAFVDGQGAIVSASRSILYAHKDVKYQSIAKDWRKCVERAVIDMKNDLAGTLQGE